MCCKTFVHVCVLKLHSVCVLKLFRNALQCRFSHGFIYNIFCKLTVKIELDITIESKTLCVIICPVLKGTIPNHRHRYFYQYIIWASGTKRLYLPNSDSRGRPPRCSLILIRSIGPTYIIYEIR